MRCSGPAQGRDGLFISGAAGSANIYQQELEEFAWEKDARDIRTRGAYRYGESFLIQGVAP